MNEFSEAAPPQPNKPLPQMAFENPKQPPSELAKILAAFKTRIDGVLKTGEPVERSQLARLVKGNSEARQEAPEPGRRRSLRVIPRAAEKGKSPLFLTVGYVDSSTDQIDLVRKVALDAQGNISTITEVDYPPDSYETKRSIQISSTSVILSQEMSDLGATFNQVSDKMVREDQGYRGLQKVEVPNPQAAAVLGFVARIDPDGSESKTTYAITANNHEFPLTLPQIHARDGDQGFDRNGERRVSEVVIAPIIVHQNIRVTPEIYLRRTGSQLYEYVIRFPVELQSQDTAKIKNPQAGNLAVPTNFIPPVRVPQMGLYGVKSSLETGFPPLYSQLMPNKSEIYQQPVSQKSGGGGFRPM